MLNVWLVTMWKFDNLQNNTQGYVLCTENEHTSRHPPPTGTASSAVHVLHPTESTGQNMESCRMVRNQTSEATCRLAHDDYSNAAALALHFDRFLTWCRGIFLDTSFPAGFAMTWSCKSLTPSQTNCRSPPRLSHPIASLANEFSPVGLSSKIRLRKCPPWRNKSRCCETSARYSA